jgi:hypothetical protein
LGKHLLLSIAWLAGSYSKLQLKPSKDYPKDFDNPTSDHRLNDLPPLAEALEELYQVGWLRG